jgi:hypothetical protein
MFDLGVVGGPPAEHPGIYAGRTIVFAAVAFGLLLALATAIWIAKTPFLTSLERTFIGTYRAFGHNLRIAEQSASTFLSIPTSPLADLI